jgi:hypothetical protein
LRTQEQSLYRAIFSNHILSELELLWYCDANTGSTYHFNLNENRSRLVLDRQLKDSIADNLNELMATGLRTLKTLLTEKEELEDLVEQYEADMSNATSLRVRIMEIVNNEKYVDDKYKENKMKRISDANDEFKSFIDDS